MPISNPPAGAPAPAQAQPDEYSTPLPAGGAQQSTPPSQDEYSTPLPTAGDQSLSNTPVPNRSPGVADYLEMGKGLIHGAADTLHGLAAGLKSSTLPGSSIVPQSAVDFLESHSHNTGTDQLSSAEQQIGYGGETLLELLLGDEALKGASLADKTAIISKNLKVVEKSPRLMQILKVGAAQVAKQSGRAGIVQGAQTLARTGDLGEAATSGAETAGATAVLGGGLEAAGGVASKLGGGAKAAGELAEVASNAPDKQTVAENIQGRLHNAETALHTNYENKIQDFEGRLDGAEIDPKGSPIAHKAEEILQQPDPEDHPSNAELKDMLGDTLDPKVRRFLENTAEGKQVLTDEDIAEADEQNANKPKLVDAQGKPIETEDVEPEAKDLPPHDAHSLIEWRQLVRAKAAEYPAGDVNARALKRLLYDATDNDGAGGSAFDDTFSQLASQSDDPEVVDEYKALRDDYRNKISKYDDPIIKNLMQGKVDDAAKAFVGTKNASGLPTGGKTNFNLSNLQELIGDPGVNQFKDQVFQNMMKEASDKNGFNPAQFISNWSRVAEGTKQDFFKVNDPTSIVSKLASDAKSAANVQKLVRAGVLGGAATVGTLHPLATGVGTLLAFVAGHAGTSHGGIAVGRDLLDYVANNPKTWALLRGVGNAAASPAAKAAASAVTTGTKAIVNQNQDSSKQKLKSALDSAFGGTPKKLTALTDSNAAPSAATPDAATAGNRAIENLPPEVRNAVSTIPVQVTQGQPMTDPNGRSSSTVTANVDQGAGNNTIEINNPNGVTTANMGHEITHVWQNNLPPSVQAKIPDDPKDMSAFDISDVDKLRKQGKTMVDLPREKAATIVEQYIKDPVKNKNLKPWIQDMGRAALSSVYPTAPDATKLNMKPRPPGLPDSSVAGMNATPTYVTPSYKAGKVPGMVEKGNVDLSNRPDIKNPNGSHSTVFSMSFGTDKGEVLVPGVGDGKTYPLRQLTTKEALDQYKKTGNNLGTFKTPAAADAYGAKLHQDQAKGKK